MITGETEYILDDNYDDFFGNKKKRRARRAKRKARRAARRSAPKRIARRAKSKAFFSKLGSAVQDMGGATAIGAAIDTITKPTQPTGFGGATEPASDFDFSIGTADVPEEEKKGIPTIVFVLGGVVVVGVVGLVVIKNRKNKQLYSQ
jgi:hypothetical protein